MTQNPSRKRVKGEEPAELLNSFVQTAMSMAPKIMPMISGRRYCTGAAV